MLDEAALVPQAMDVAWSVVPQGLMRSPFVVEVDVSFQGGSCDLQGGIGGIQVDLLLLDGTVPSLLPGIVGGTIGPARREEHLQIPDQPSRAPLQIGRSPVRTKQRLGMLLLKPLAQVGQDQKVLHLSMGDALDDAPGDDVAREVVDDGQQVMPHAGDVQEGPVLAPDLVGTIGFVMGNFPGSLSQLLGDHPSLRFQGSIAAGGADPEALGSQMTADPPRAQLRFGLLLLKDRLALAVGQAEDGRGSF